MAERRDYYEVLGIARTATADEIKMAYRKAAMKWHPDRWVEGTDAEKKTAEEKFKEASEAYSVLSDPDKKAKYDQFGFAGVDSQGAPDFSGGFGNLEDILRDLFGGSFGGFGGGFSGFGFGNGGSARTQTRVYKGRDIRTRVRLTLEEIAKGVEMLNEYASRAWAGLTETYYAYRWKEFFKDVDAAIEAKDTFDEKAYHERICKYEGLWWRERLGQFNAEPQGDAIALAKAIADRYREQLNTYYN